MYRLIWDLTGGIWLFESLACVGSNIASKNPLKDPLLSLPKVKTNSVLKKKAYLPEFIIPSYNYYFLCFSDKNSFEGESANVQASYLSPL